MLKRQAWAVFAMVSLTFLAPAAYAEESYGAAMKRDLGRGFKNVISFPLEIPMTIQEYHEAPGLPAARHLAGFADGIFQGVARFGSGAWDFVAALTPGIQEGLPVQPQTLF